MDVVDVETPDAPGPGEVLLAPEAVGLCGSDFHYFLGDIGALDDPASLYPRIQGHEAAAVIVELGADRSATPARRGCGSRSGPSTPAETATRAASAVATRACRSP